jgi:hypothetical protein
MSKILSIGARPVWKLEVSTLRVFLKIRLTLTLLSLRIW